VGDEKVAQPQLSLKLLQQVQYLSLNGDVKRAGGLVTNNEFGLDGQATRDANALSLAA